jgi:glutamyl-tRNA reductase
VFSKGNIPDTGRRVVVDLGFPRNVDPEVRSLKSVELLDLDDIASLASRSNDGAKLTPARKAVEAEALRFHRWLIATRLNPALASIYMWAEHVREDEAASALRRLPSLSDKERRVVEVMSRRLVSKLMAPHAEFAKGDVSPSSQAQRLRLLEKIFAVEDPD